MKWRPELFFVRWSILERSVKSSGLERSERLFAEAKQHVTLAQIIYEPYLGQTRGILKDISDVNVILEDESFYTLVNNEEKRQVYAAIAWEFTGTGH